MKQLIYFAALSLFFLSSCTKEDTCVIKLNKPFTIAYSQVACSETEQFAVKFDSVVTDCRCPANAMCIWAGYAEIKLSLLQNNTQTDFYLSTLYSKTDTVVGGYRFHLNSIDPYPGSFSTPVTKEDYVANITVSK
ncbi:MAG: hypothetical protein QM725_10850 [Lacibacter sp.]